MDAHAVQPDATTDDDSDQESQSGPLYRVPSFDDFYASQFARVVASVRPLAGSWAVAQEVTQEAFVDAFHRWEKISAYDRPEMWVRRAAMNRAVSSHRRRKAERRALRRHGPDRSETPPSDADAAYAHLLALVAQLPRRQAAAVSLVYIDQLSTADAAEVMRCSESTVRSHLERARSRLQETLTEEDQP